MMTVTRFSSLFACLLVLFAALMSACGAPPQPRTVTLNGQTMGTTYTVKYIAPADVRLPDAAQVQRELDALLAEVNRQMSTYDEASEISRFNRLDVGAGMNISADFAQVLGEAVRLNRLTEGALDVTIGPVVNVWGFGPDKSMTRAPDEAVLAAARQRVGLDKIRIEPQAQGARLTKLADGVALDLPAIAKGFGVDKLAQHLEGLGVRQYLVEIGGELRGKGYNAQGTPWRVGIETPQAVQQGSLETIISLDQRALATSGDYRNFRVDEHGERLSHIIDPTSGKPIRHRLASVTVVADTTTTADGLATGLFVLGEEKALALAEQHGWPVFVIVHDGDGFRTDMSSAFKQLLQK